MANKTFDLQVNGARRRVEVDPGRSLLSVLRDELDLTGSKYGCGEGSCGACTVLLDGAPTRACITAVSTVAGKSIATIESLENNGKLHPLQQAFIDHGALQCGYCTAGMLMSAAGLLRQNKNPNEDQIVEFMEGNICRCGTYLRIIQAIGQAAAEMRGSV